MVNEFQIYVEDPRILRKREKKKQEISFLKKFKTLLVEGLGRKSEMIRAMILECI